MSRYWCYQSHEDWPETCRFRGCSNNADDSAHVVDDEEFEYIIPICNFHNGTGFSETFSVKSGTFADYIDEEEILTDLVANLTDDKERTLETGSEVRNIEGTSECSARGYDSWKAFYKGGKRGHNSRPWPKECRIHGCTKKATDGAHVECEDDSGVWIIPMCRTHNNPSNEEWMTVNAGTTAVQVEEEDTSGIPWTCFTCKEKRNMYL